MGERSEHSPGPGVGLLTDAHGEEHDSNGQAGRRETAASVSERTGPDGRPGHVAGDDGAEDDERRCGAP